MAGSDVIVKWETTLPAGLNATQVPFNAEIVLGFLMDPGGENLGKFIHAIEMKWNGM